MTRSLIQLLVATTLGISCLPHFSSAIETVDELIVSKYLGRWYQVSERVEVAGCAPLIPCLCSSYRLGAFVSI